MRKIIWTIIILILIILGVWYFTTKSTKNEVEIINPNTGTEITDQGNENTNTATEEKTPIEIAFEKAEDVAIQGEKAKVVDETMRPVLKSVFDKTLEDQTISGVKMVEEFGPMLTYSFISKLTEQERDSIIEGLVTGGAQVLDKTEKVYTIQKGLGSSWVITFYLNNDQKSGLEITF